MMQLQNLEVAFEKVKQKLLQRINEEESLNESTI